MDNMTIDEALAHFGTRYRLAMVLGLKYNTPYYWRGPNVPKAHVQRLREMISAPATPVAPEAESAPSAA